MNAHPILTSTGSFLAPPQSSHDDRPAGPWIENRIELRGRDVRQALAGEIPVRRIVLGAPASPEVLAEIANGRRV